MGFIVLLLLAASLAFVLEAWLKRWWIAGIAPVVVYFAYVWLDVNVLPSHRGGFPGWEVIVAISILVIVPGSVAGVWAARRWRRSPRGGTNAL
jgi:hypothetical protein